MLIPSWPGFGEERVGQACDLRPFGAGRGCPFFPHVFRGVHSAPSLRLGFINLTTCTSISPFAPKMRQASDPLLLLPALALHGLDSHHSLRRPAPPRSTSSLSARVFLLQLQHSVAGHRTGHPWLWGGIIRLVWVDWDASPLLDRVSAQPLLFRGQSWIQWRSRLGWLHSFALVVQQGELALRIERVVTCVFGVLWFVPVCP